MDANKAWNVAKGLQGTTLHRWTKTGKSGQPFTYRIRNVGRGPAIAFVRNGREVKSASEDRFRRFFSDWYAGHDSADHFHNDGQLKSEAQVAKFLIPVYEMVLYSDGPDQPAPPRVTLAELPPTPVNSEQAESSKTAAPDGAIKHTEFDAKLRHLVPETDVSRPFMCDGDPLAAELFIVALNPGTDIPFWKFWNGREFDKGAWLQAYLQKHGYYKTTRRYLERLIDRLNGVPWLETNLYPYPSREIKDLPAELQKPDVLDFLVTSIQPRVMFIMGADSIKYVCKQGAISGLPKDESFTTVTWGGISIDVMVENHFAVQMKYWDDTKVDRIGAALKARF